jgi:hypothetical protein
MRNYLYLWHQPATHCLIASGIEFRDLIPELAGSGGVVLLRHQFDDASFDRASRLQFVQTNRLDELANDNVNSYGDFCWADFGPGVSIADLSDSSVAELMFFAHAARPLHSRSIPGLENHFLYYSHDDGWYARIFYRDWNLLVPALHRLFGRLLNQQQIMQAIVLVQRGTCAYWCCEGAIAECEATEDIDSLQRKNRID